MGLELLSTGTNSAKMLILVPSHGSGSAIVPPEILSTLGAAFLLPWRPEAKRRRPFPFIRGCRDLYSTGQTFEEKRAQCSASLGVLQFAASKAHGVSWRGSFPLRPFLEPGQVFRVVDSTEREAPTRKQTLKKRIHSFRDGLRPIGRSGRLSIGMCPRR